MSDKIRTNAEIVSFIKNVIDLKNKPKRYIDYSNIEVLYADNYETAKEIVRHYVNDKNYKFISYTPSRIRSDIDQFRDYVNTHHIIGQEFDNVIFLWIEIFDIQQKEDCKVRSIRILTIYFINYGIREFLAQEKNCVF